jgi:hypothetical protein
MQSSYQFGGLAHVPDFWSEPDALGGDVFRLLRVDAQLFVNWGSDALKNRSRVAS